MKCNLKRLICTVISAAMIFTSVPVTALAAPGAVPEEEIEAVSEEETVAASEEDALSEEMISEGNISEEDILEETIEAEGAEEDVPEEEEQQEELQDNEQQSEEIITAEGDEENANLKIENFDDYNGLLTFYYRIGNNSEYTLIDAGTNGEIDLPVGANIYAVNSSENRYGYRLTYDGNPNTGFVLENSADSGQQSIWRLEYGPGLYNLSFEIIPVQRVTLVSDNRVSMYTGYDFDSQEYTGQIESGSTISVRAGDNIYFYAELGEGEAYSYTRSDNETESYFYGNSYTIPDDIDGVTLTFGIYRFPYADYSYSVVDNTKGAVGLYYDYNCENPLDSTGKYSGTYGFKDSHIYAKITGEVPTESYYVVKNKKGGVVAKLEHDWVEYVWYGDLKKSDEVLTIEEVSYPSATLDISDNFSEMASVYSDAACTKKLKSGDSILSSKNNTLYYKLNSDVEEDKGYSVDSKFMLSDNNWSYWYSTSLDSDNSIGAVSLNYPTSEEDVVFKIEMNGTYLRVPFIIEKPEEGKYDLSGEISITRQVRTVSDNQLVWQWVELASGDYVSGSDQIGVRLTGRLKEENTRAKISVVFHYSNSKKKYSSEKKLFLTEENSSAYLNLWSVNPDSEKIVLVAEEVKKPSLVITDPENIGEKFVVTDEGGNTYKNGDFIPEYGTRYFLKNNADKAIVASFSSDYGKAKRMRTIIAKGGTSNKCYWSGNDDLEIELSYATGFKIALSPELLKVADVYNMSGDETALKSGDTIVSTDTLKIKLKSNPDKTKEYRFEWIEWHDDSGEDWDEFASSSLDSECTECEFDVPAIFEGADYEYPIKMEVINKAIFHIDTTTDKDNNFGSNVEYFKTWWDENDDCHKVQLHDGDYVKKGQNIVAEYSGTDPAESEYYALTLTSKYEKREEVETRTSLFYFDTDVDKHVVGLRDWQGDKRRDDQILTVTAFARRVANPKITIVDTANFGDKVRLYYEKDDLEDDDADAQKVYLKSGDSFPATRFLRVENGCDTAIYISLSDGYEDGIGAHGTRWLEKCKKDVTVTLGNLPVNTITIDSSGVPEGNEFAVRSFNDDYFESEMTALSSGDAIPWRTNIDVKALKLKDKNSALRVRMICGKYDKTYLLREGDCECLIYDVTQDMSIIADVVTPRKLKIGNLEGAVLTCDTRMSVEENTEPLNGKTVDILPGDRGHIYFQDEDLKKSDKLEDYLYVIRVFQTIGGETKVKDYVYSEEYECRSTSFTMPDSDMELSFDIVKAYHVTDPEGRMYWDLSSPGKIEIWQDEWDRSDTYIAEGETVRVLFWNSLRFFTKLDVYSKYEPATKVVDNLDVDYRMRDCPTFTMPSYPIIIDINETDRNAHEITIDKSNLTAGNDAYVEVKNKNDWSRLESGDTVYETQDMCAGVRAIEDDKQMMVSVTKTGTNEIVTGSKKGNVIDVMKKFFFGMPDDDITVSFTQRTVKGEGRKLTIAEDISASSSVAYSAEGKETYSLESGDRVKPGDKVVIDISTLTADSAVAISAVCPDENMVASGAGITNDFTKAYYSKIVKKTGKVSFTMPDYPLELSVREMSAADIDVMESDIKEAEVTLKKTSFTFTGEAIEPEFDVKLDGATLKLGTDYTAEYSNNVNKGTASIELTGVGKYSGNRTINFSIAPRNIEDESVVIGMADRVLFTRVREYEPVPFILLGEKKFEAKDNLTVKYSNNTGVTDNAKAEITGVGNFTGSVTKYFEIYKETEAAVDIASAVISFENDSFEYTGQNIEPEFTVKYADVVLDAGVDYTYSFSNNRDCGVAVLTIAGMGAFTGTQTKTFTITKRSFDSELFVATIANVKYARKTKEYTPAPIVVYGGEKLIPDVDYSLSYADNDGTKEDASVIITGIHNFSGTRQLSFKILKETVASTKFSVTLSDKKYTYDGTEKCPAVTVKYGGDPVDAEDYEVVYYDNIDAGNARVCIVGMGPFSGTKEVKYKIEPAQLTDSNTVIDAIPDQVYSGEVRPDVVVRNKATGKEIAASDLKISYANNKKVGTAKVTVKGQNNYRGTIKTTFNIGAMGFDDYEYSIEDQLYTGKKCTPNIIAIHKTTGEVIELSSKNAFKVKWAENKEVGTATATFEPKNKNTFVFDSTKDNKKVIEFSIVKTDLALARIAEISDQKYKKNREAKPKISVYVGNTKISNSKLKIEYGNNKAKGIATVTITSADADHFTGTQTATFTIK